jgi:hypothetical protein
VVGLANGIGGFNMRLFLYYAAVAATTILSTIPLPVSAQSDHRRYEGQCQIVHLVAHIAIQSSQFGHASIEDTLDEYTSPSVFRTAAQRAVYERIIRDAYSRPIMVEGGSMPADVYREVIDGFAEEWAGSCARGELYNR